MIVSKRKAQTVSRRRGRVARASLADPGHAKPPSPPVFGHEPPPDARSRERHDLGERLRALRQERGLTLNDVARRTGLSRSTLYKVENSGMSLTYQKLLQLKDGLGVDIAQLFHPTPEVAEIPSAFREVGRQGEGDLVSTPNYDHYYLCNEIVHKALTPIYGKIKVRAINEFGELSTHPGEEFTYVLEGTVEVHTRLYRPVILNAGDYVYVSSTMPHAYINKGPGTATILTVCSGPEESRAAAASGADGGGVDATPGLVVRRRDG